MDSGVGLLERDRELGVLEAAVVAAAAGAGHAIVIEGPPGIGKTRLLAEARSLASGAGFRVLGAHGSQLEEGFGFGVARQLLERVAADADAELLAGPAGQARTVLSVVPSREGAVGDFAVIHGLYWLVANLCAREPVCLVVDDLHWVDPGSLRFLAYLQPRLDGLPLLVVCATRPTVRETPERLLAQLTGDPAVTVLLPAPLSTSASARLVRAVAGPDADEEYCAACHRLTEGNPVLLRELAAAAAAEHIPPTTAGVPRLSAIGGRAVGRRVSRQLLSLGPQAAAVAGAAAVLGDGADLGHVPAVAGLDPTRTLELVDRLSTMDILRPGPRVEFLHPLVRSAVYDGLTAAAVASMHQAAARVLATAGTAPSHVASHLLRTPPLGDADTVPLLRRAAAEALTRAAPDSALAYLERALPEPRLSGAERVEILTDAGAVARLVDWPRAVELLSQALEGTTGARQRGEVVDMLGGALAVVGRGREAIEIYRRAVAEVGEEPADLVRRLQAGLIGVAASDGMLSEVPAGWLARLAGEPPGDGLGARMLDGVLALIDSRAEVSARRALRALDDGSLLEHGNGSFAFLVACCALVMVDRDEVMRVFDDAMARAHHTGSTHVAAAVSCFRAAALARRGSLAEAEADARQSLRLFDTVGANAGRPFAIAYLADSLLDQGRPQEAGEVLDLIDPVQLPANPRLMIELRRASVLLLQGRTAEGLTATLDCGRRYGKWPHHMLPQWRLQAALALDMVGRRAEGLALATEELTAARSWNAPLVLGRSLWVTGLLTGGDAGLDLLADAVAVLESSPARLEHARALVEYGAALRDAGRAGQARPHLALAFDMADRCGSPPVADRARGELRAAGARVRRRGAVTGAAALTPSELKVAEYAASGRNNREIAQALFVTQKTVEVHLTNVYRKLGARNRSELAPILALPV